MSRDRIDDVLSDPGSHMHTSGGILYGLVLIICQDLNIGPNEFFNLLDQYIDRDNKLPIAKKSTERSNLSREIFKPNISMSRFLRFLEILGTEELTLSATIDRKGKNRTTHTITVSNLGEFIPKRKPRRKKGDVKDDDDKPEDSK